MKRVLVRYRVKPDRADENQALIEKVFEQLKTGQPPGLRYASFRLEDDVTFVHIASIETTDGSNPLAGLDAFQVFTEDIKERCDEPPVAMGMTEIGSYRLLED
jgi:hypothetical protein